MQKDTTKRGALRFILLMGAVSLLGDITYEGGRSVYGPYLALLGAGAGMVGFVAGFGELLGYGLRLASGYLADRTSNYWLPTFIGYALVFAVPLLAFTGHWQAAVVLILFERMGKAVRSPSRDALLSHAARQVGRGWGFGIHEALDQTGAVLGPLVFTGVFLAGGDYRGGFLLMFVPAALMMAALFVARARVPSSEEFERGEEDVPGFKNMKGGVIASLWRYTAFISATVAGFAGFPLISYHFKVQNVVPDLQIPVLYAIAMAADGLTALVTGTLYDRAGMKTLLAVPLLSAALPFLVFSESYYLSLAGMLVWGAVLGAHETVLRAAAADLSATGNRGTAFGVFNAAYGLAFFAGSTLMGALYGLSVSHAVIFIVACQALSLPLFFLSQRTARV